MRRVQKGAEPTSLIEFRSAQKTGEYPKLEQAPLGAKDDLRVRLVGDQRGLCCYCQRRIVPTRESMKIEHFLPQSVEEYRTDRLRWRNLLGACLGGDGEPPASQTCDTRKGDRELSISPLTVRQEEFTYRANGELHHPDKTDHLNEVLNLNAAALKRARKQAWGSFALRKDWNVSRLKAELSDLEGDGAQLPVFAGLLAFVLRRKLRQKGAL